MLNYWWKGLLIILKFVESIHSEKPVIKSQRPNLHDCRGDISFWKILIINDMDWDLFVCICFQGSADHCMIGVQLLSQLTCEMNQVNDLMCWSMTCILFWLSLHDYWEHINLCSIQIVLLEANLRLLIRYKLNATYK